QVEVLQPEMEVLVEIVLETDLRAIALQQVEAPAGADRDRTVGGVSDRSWNLLAARVERDVGVVEQTGRDVHLPAPPGRRGVIDDGGLRPARHRHEEQHRGERAGAQPTRRLGCKQNGDLLTPRRQRRITCKADCQTFPIWPVRRGAWGAPGPAPGRSGPASPGGASGASIERRKASRSSREWKRAVAPLAMCSARPTNGSSPLRCARPG